MQIRLLVDKDSTMKKSIICLLSILPFLVKGQDITYIRATRHDPVYTVYAAPPERTTYLCDQGYQLLWNDESSGIAFFSAAGPGFGMAFQTEDRLIYKVGELYEEPVITTTLSDAAELSFRPLTDLKVNLFFAVYSSRAALAEYRLENTGDRPLSVTLHPFLFFPSTDTTVRIRKTGAETFGFPLYKPRDSWLQQHQIPLAERFNCRWSLSGITTGSGKVFARKIPPDIYNEEAELLEPLISSWLPLYKNSAALQGVLRHRSVTLSPGDVTRIRMVIEVNPEISTQNPGFHTETGALHNLSLQELVIRSRAAYRAIPHRDFADNDHKLLYLSAFSLMRQCMMPPEGACHYPYYVFSREPRWGWGYGGQVFHESLTMPFYALMDAKGAMNSQRVFMERQRSDGYINYRTGPYLDETIETNGMSTTSAPWFSYTNMEIYNITRDRAFLDESYLSGKKLYDFFITRRDSNQNGLCEWGGHAELESVRDARVAVWDLVGRASNFEGPDLNSMLVMEARSLSEMAHELGKTDEAAEWRSRAQTLKEKIDSRMWDPATNFYYNINRNDQTFTFRNENDLKIMEIIGFLPLWAGIPDSNRAASLVSMLTDSTLFWRRFGIPSLTASHPYYCPIGYWNGPVWVQWNYLIYRGLLNYGYHSEANQLAARVIDNMIYHLRKDHTFWEFYSADDRQAGWNRSYIWAGTVIGFMKER